MKKLILASITMMMAAGPLSAAILECGVDRGRVYDSTTGAWKESLKYSSYKDEFWDPDTYISTMRFELTDELIDKLDKNEIFKLVDEKNRDLYIKGDNSTVSMSYIKFGDGDMKVYRGTCRTKYK